MADLRLVAAEVDTHARIREALRLSLLAIIEQLIRGFGSRGVADARAALTPASAAQAATAIATAAWYSNAEVDALSGQLASYAEASQRQVAASADAYLSRVLGTMTEQPFPTVGQADPSTLRAGTTHADAYGRLARQFRWELSQGTPPGEALGHVVTRAEAMAETDLALADRAQVLRVVDASPQTVTAYRRIVRPELSKDGACGLCIVASDRLYFRGDLAGLHGRCKCAWLPVIGEQDPGRTLNREDLDALYARAGGTDRAKLKRIRVTEAEHGEMGRVLVVEGQHYRGPEDLDAAA